MKEFVRLLPMILVSFGLIASDGNFHSDPVGDIDRNGSAVEDQTDIISTDFDEDAENFIVTMTMKEDIEKNFGYKEYYFWIDSDPSLKKGYQPYNPHSVAWPDMYADHRFFISIDANNRERFGVEKIAIQDCAATDCANDEGFVLVKDLKAKISKNTVTFKWPKSLIPSISAAKELKVGFTTFYEISRFNSNGEDDSPQWGENAFVIKR